MTKDPLTTLEKLRPSDTVSAELWPENVQDAARTRIMATENNMGQPKLHAVASVPSFSSRRSAQQWWWAAPLPRG